MHCPAVLLHLQLEPRLGQSPGVSVGAGKLYWVDVSVNKHRTEPQHADDLSNQMGMPRALM